MGDYDTKYQFSPMYCDGEYERKIKKKITNILVGLAFFPFLLRNRINYHWRGRKIIVSSIENQA